MQIKLKLVGAFQIGRFKEDVRAYRDSITVQEIVDDLQLPEQILGIVLINGIHATFETVLQDGDSLTLLPILDGG